MVARSNVLSLAGSYTASSRHSERVPEHAATFALEAKLCGAAG
jgi:hypothetical protein